MSKIVQEVKEERERWTVRQCEERRTEKETEKKIKTIKTSPIGQRCVLSVSLRVLTLSLDM